MAVQSNGISNITPGLADDRKLFVGGTGRNITDKELSEYFSKFGEIESITIKNDPVTGLSRGFAFILFKAAKTVDDLLAAGDHFIGNKKVDPKRVTKKQSPLKCRIFVGGITSEISDGDIKEYFSKFGNIVEIQTPYDKTKNQRKGFSFVTFDNKDVVNEVLKNPKQIIKGKEVDVKKVKFNPETMGGFPGAATRGGRGGGFAGRGGYGGPYGAVQGGYDNYGTEYAGYEAGYGTGYPGYDYGYGGGYSGYTAPAAPAYGGGKFRENQYQRHQPY